MATNGEEHSRRARLFSALLVNLITLFFLSPILKRTADAPDSPGGVVVCLTARGRPLRLNRHASGSKYGWLTGVGGCKARWSGTIVSMPLRRSKATISPSFARFGGVCMSWGRLGQTQAPARKP